MVRRRLVYLYVVVALFSVNFPLLHALNVAHEGFPDPATVSAVLENDGGHRATALTAQEVIDGRLAGGDFDVFVISRESTENGAPDAYVDAVDTFVGSGGNIVTEFSGVGMFFSSFAPDASTSFSNTSQLGIFDGSVHAGLFHQTDTTIQFDTEHPLSLGPPRTLPPAFSEGDGTQFFAWIDSADPDLEVVGTFTGNGNPGFPARDLPTALVGCDDGSSFVFGTWCYADTAFFVDQINRRFFLNAVDFAGRGTCNRLPTCDIAIDPVTIECAGAMTEVRLDASASSDADGDPLSFSWSVDCAEGSFDDPTSPMPTLSLDTSQNCSLDCRVTVVVSDGLGISECSRRVTVEDLPPPLAECGILLDKVKLRWNKDPLRLDVRGDIRLPEGVDPRELSPVATLRASVAREEIIFRSPIEFAVHGADSKKWRFKERDVAPALRKFYIDWTISRSGDDDSDDDDSRDSAGRFRLSLDFQDAFPLGVDTLPREISLEVGLDACTGTALVNSDALVIVGTNWKLETPDDDD